MESEVYCLCIPLTEKFIVGHTYNSNAIEGNTLTLREPDMVLRGMAIIAD